MTERLTQHSVDSQNVIDDRVEDDELHVELLFVEGPQSTLDIALELFLCNRHVVLLDVATEQYWSL